MSNLFTPHEDSHPSDLTPDLEYEPTFPLIDIYDNIEQPQEIDGSI